jgi:hypothetical protein
MYSRHWVEQVRQTDTMRLRNKSEQMPVPVEAPRATVLHYFEARLVMAIESAGGGFRQIFEEYLDDRPLSGAPASQYPAAESRSAIKQPHF